MYYTLYAFLTIIIIIIIIIIVVVVVVFQLKQSAIIKRALIGVACVLACAGKGLVKKYRGGGGGPEQRGGGS